MADSGVWDKAPSTMVTQHAEPSGEASGQGCWQSGWEARGEAGSWEG